MGSNTYDYQRVHRVNLILVFIIVFLIVIPRIFENGFQQSGFMIIAGIFALVLAVVNYFIKISSFIKGIIFAAMPNIIVMSLFYMEGYSLSKHYLLILSIAMVVLYFKQSLILLFSLLINSEYIVTYLLRPKDFLGDDSNWLHFFILIFLVNCVLTILYFLTEWGRNLIQSSKDKEKEANTILEKLKNTFGSIEAGAETLENNVAQFRQMIESFSESSHSIKEAVQQMTAGIQDQANSVSYVNESMATSMDKASRTIQISQEIARKSEEMNEKVQDGWKKINLVTQHFTTVNSAITTTTQTVTELQVSLEKVNELLDGIKDIANQTNLLALNAAIESARAGEHGKGFAVVASEVRKLAEQSGKLATSISEVTETLFHKSKEAQLKSVEGEHATKEGGNLLTEVATYFQEIKTSFQETNHELSKGMEEIKSATNNFSEIGRQIENVANISEESVASMEEISSTLENEENQVNIIKHTVEEINALAKQLKQLMEKNE